MGNNIKDAALEARRMGYLKSLISLQDAKTNHAIYKDRNSLEKLKIEMKEAKKFYLKIPSDICYESLFGLINSGVPSLYSQSAY